MSALPRRLGLVAAGAAVGLAFAEVAARLAAASAAEELLFRAPDGALRAMYQDDPELLHVPVPGFAGVSSAPGYSVAVHIDARGLRDESDARGGWLAVGDSFTLSAQVDVAETFEARLAGALGVPVHNAGVDGYSTWQALGRWRRLDPVVGSDTALLVFFLGNDLTDNEVFPLLQRASAPLPEDGGRGRAAENAPPPPPEMGMVEDLLFRHSRLYAWLRVAEARRALTDPANKEAEKFRNELVPFTRGGAGRLAQLVEVARTPLTQLRDATRASGDRLLVAIAPPVFAVDSARAAPTLAAFGLSDPDVDAPRQAVMRLLGELGVATCDLTPALQAAQAAGRAPYLRYDGHWSPAGHEAVAGAIEACARSAW